MNHDSITFYQILPGSIRFCSTKVKFQKSTNMQCQIDILIAYLSDVKLPLWQARTYIMMKLHIWTVISKLGHSYGWISLITVISIIYSRTHTHIYTFLTHFRTFFYSWIKLRYSVHLHLSTCEYLTKNFIISTLI